MKLTWFFVPINVNIQSSSAETFHNQFTNTSFIKGWNSIPNTRHMDAWKLITSQGKISNSFEASSKGRFVEAYCKDRN